MARAEALEAEARAAFAKVGVLPGWRLCTFSQSPVVATRQYDTNRSSTIEEAELTALLADFGFDTAVSRAARGRGRPHV